MFRKTFWIEAGFHKFKIIIVNHKGTITIVLNWSLIPNF